MRKKKFFVDLGIIIDKVLQKKCTRFRLCIYLKDANCLKIDPSSDPTSSINTLAKSSTDFLHLANKPSGSTLSPVKLVKTPETPSSFAHDDGVNPPAQGLSFSASRRFRLIWSGRHETETDVFISPRDARPNNSSLVALG